MTYIVNVWDRLLTQYIRVRKETPASPKSCGNDIFFLHESENEPWHMQGRSCCPAYKWIRHACKTTESRRVRMSLAPEGSEFKIKIYSHSFGNVIKRHKNTSKQEILACRKIEILRKWHICAFISLGTTWDVEMVMKNVCVKRSQWRNIPWVKHT